jgi:oligosaccharide repeat unit polymerase
VETGLTFSLNSATLAWGLFLLFVFFVFRRCVGYKQVNTFSIFLPLTLATNGILVPFSQQLNEQMTAFEITKFSAYWIGLALMYATMPLGILIANGFRNKDQLSDAELQWADVVGSPRGVRIYLVIVLLISLISIVQIYASGLGFDLYSYFTLKMDYLDYAAHRYDFAEATRGWPFFLYNKLPYGLAPLSIIIAWNARGWEKWKKAVFLGILTIAILQTGHKMPLIMLMACLILSGALIQSRFRISRTVIWVGLAVLLAAMFVVIPIFYMMQGEETYGSAAFWAAERIFLEPARGLQLYFETYPAIHPFLHGASTGAIANLFGVKDYVTPSLYIPNQVLGIENTSFPVLFIGEAWADFGYWGIALSSVAAGFLLQIYNVWFFNQKKPRLEEVAVFISIVLSTIHLQASNLLTSLFSYGMLSSFLIYLVIRRCPEHAVAPHRVEAGGILRPDVIPPSRA